MRKLLFILSIIALLFLYGCTSKFDSNNLKLPCCVSIEDGKCTQLWFNGKAISEEAFTSYLSSNGYTYHDFSCGDSSCGVDVTYYDPVTHEQKSERFSIPLCNSLDQVDCLPDSCEAMICSAPNYKPLIVGSESDYARLLEGPVCNGDQKKGLLDAYCVITSSKAAQNILASNGFYNVFRVGLGSSFADYDYARYYFPISDYLCGINENGKVDRFMNYLGLKDSGQLSHYYDVYTIPNQCVMSNRSEYLEFLEDVKLANGWLEYPSFVSENYTHQEDGKYRTLGNDIDRSYYAQKLKEEYGANGAIDSADPFPFECANSKDCRSAQCSYNNYLRGLCINTSSKETSYCQCFGIGEPVNRFVFCEENDEDEESLQTVLLCKNEDDATSYCKQRGISCANENVTSICKSVSPGHNVEDESNYLFNSSRLDDKILFFDGKCEIYYAQSSPTDIGTMPVNDNVSFVAIAKLSYSEFIKSDFYKSCHPSFYSAYFGNVSEQCQAYYYRKDNSDVPRDRYITFITDTGDCQYYNSYGWCEPCTSLSLPFQRLILKTSDNGIPIFKDINPFLFSQRIEQYLAEGSMPVIDASDDSLWTIPSMSHSLSSKLKRNIDDDSGIEPHFSFLDLIGNKGPVIVIIKNLSNNSIGSQEELNEIVYSASAVKKQCPKCLVAIQLVSNSSNKFKDYDNILRYLFNLDQDKDSCYETSPIANCNRSTLSLIDIVAIQWYPYEIVSSTSSSYSNEYSYGYESDYYLINDLTNFTYSTLRAYNKPTLISDLKINFCSYSTQPCWDNDDDRIGSFLRVLLLKKSTLVSNGIIGVIYPYWKDEIEEGYKNNSSYLVHTIYETMENEMNNGINGGIVNIDNEDINKVKGIGDRDIGDIGDVGVGGDDEDNNEPQANAIYDEYKGTEFCSFERASYFVLYGKPKTITTKVYARDLTCQQATSVEKFERANFPNGAMTCVDGQLCNIPDSCEEDSSYCAPENLSCPDGIPTLNCPLCKDVSGTLKCKRIYFNGDVQFLPPISISSLSDEYADFIAALPYGYKCCLIENTSQVEEPMKYTYISSVIQTKNSVPIIFSKDPIQKGKCIVSPDQLANVTGACGASDVFQGDYILQCEFENS